MNQKALKSWDLNIDQAPIKMTTSVLTTPSLLVQNQIVMFDENKLK